MGKEALLKTKDGEVTCSVCGRNLTKYGSKTLADGILCRNCAKLVSGWYTSGDLAERTVEQVKEHLDYRQNNLAVIKGFNGLKVVEGKYSLFVDDTKRQFVISKRDDLVKENADVFSLSMIENMRIIEKRYKTKSGSDIMVEILVKHPQFRSLRFQVNEFGCLERDSAEFRLALQLAYKYINAFKKRK